MPLGPGGQALPSELQQAAPAVRAASRRQEAAGAGPGGARLPAQVGLACRQLSASRADPSVQKQGRRPAGASQKVSWGSAERKVSTASQVTGRWGRGPCPPTAGTCRLQALHEMATHGNSVTPKVPGAWVSISLSGQWAPCNGGLLWAPALRLTRWAVRGRGRPWGPHPHVHQGPQLRAGLPGLGVLGCGGGASGSPRVKAVNLPWAAAVGSPAGDV